jgi:hypothetical protein
LDEFDPSARAAPLIVKERTGRTNALFGFIGLLIGLALVRGHFGAETTKGRIVMWVVMGGFFVLWVVAWIYVARRPARLEITHDAIVLAHRGGMRTQSMPRTTGTLYIRLGGGRHPQAILRTDDSNEGFFVWMFDRDELVRACVASGWHFGQPSDWRWPEG